MRYFTNVHDLGDLKSALQVAQIMRYFTNVHDLGDLKSALAEAFEIKKDRYKYETLGKHKTCLLIFFNPQ